MNPASLAPVPDKAPGWTHPMLVLAGVYNLIWGAAVVLFPNFLFDWLSLELPRYPQIWQCVGMIVGVYGIGYLIAAGDSRRHWPLVLVGLLGKICGPLGFLFSALQGDLPWRFGVTLLTNDLVWWIPFGMILYDAWRHDRAFKSRGPITPGSTVKAC